MNSGYSRVYAPVLRGPLLFHHNNGCGHSCPTYKPAPISVAQSTAKFYPAQPNSTYRSQYDYTIQTQLRNNLQSFPYYSANYSAMPKAMIPAPINFSSYSVPTVTYTSTVSSKGLSLILIATLMLVALDLVIVRPQKR